MKVTLNYSKNLHFIATARHFKNIHIDEPESFHGSDFGPSSVEYLLIGIGGCMGSSFIFCLQKKDIEIDNLEVIVDGKLKHIGPKMSLKLVDIDVEIKFLIKEKSPREEIDSCIKEFRDYCVVSNSIIQGIPIKVKVSKR